MAQHIIKAIGIGLLLASAPATAANWQRMAATDTTVYSIDQDSISRSGKLVIAWMKAVGPVYGFPQGVATKSRYEINCAAGTSRLTSSTIYDHAGAVVRVYSWVPGENAARRPIAESASGIFIRRACDTAAGATPATRLSCTDCTRRQRLSASNPIAGSWVEDLVGADGFEPPTSSV